MNILDLKNLLETSLNFPFYINEFPAEVEDDCGVIQLTGGMAKVEKDVDRPTFQILIRAEDPAVADEKARESWRAYGHKTDFTVGVKRVILCYATNSTPLYIGKDDNGRTLYSINFQTITE